MAYILSVLRSKPVTIEAPLIRRHSQLDDMVRLFLEHDLHMRIEAVNIPYHSFGRYTCDPGYTAKYLMDELRIQPIVHLPLGVENRYTLVGKLIHYSFIGVEALLLISGDLKLGDVDYAEAARLIKSFRDGVVDADGRGFKVDRHVFIMGGAIIPYREDELERIRFKHGLGIRFFQTQVVVEAEPMKRLIEAGLPRETPILVGVAPHLGSMEKYLGGLIPGYPPRDMPRSQRGYLEWLASQAGEILDIGKSHGLEMGIHIYPVAWSGASISAASQFLDLLGRL